MAIRASYSTAKPNPRLRRSIADGSHCWNASVALSRSKAFWPVRPTCNTGGLRYKLLTCHSQESRVRYNSPDIVVRIEVPARRSLGAVPAGADVYAASDRRLQTVFLRC